jgi:hypothetical protein
VALEITGTKDDAGSELKVLEAPDNEVAVSSYPFTYSDPHHPRMRHLREKYCLEDIVKDGKTDAEKFMLLSQWIREQWEGWDMGKYDYCPQWDALEILELAPAKLGLGMCTHYSAVFVQCAAALGYHARSVIVDHHCLAEAWSDQYGKWMFGDGIFPAIRLRSYEVMGHHQRAQLHERFLAADAMKVKVLPDPPISRGVVEALSELCAGSQFRCATTNSQSGAARTRTRPRSTTGTVISGGLTASIRSIPIPFKPTVGRFY